MGLIHSRDGMYFHIKIDFAFSFRVCFYYEKKNMSERKKTIFFLTRHVKRHRPA